MVNTEFKKKLGETVTCINFITNSDANYGILRYSMWNNLTYLKNNIICTIHIVHNRTLMNKRLLLISCVISVILGMIIYAYFNEWIIIRNPLESLQHHGILAAKLRKKEVTLFFWRHEQWHKEAITLSVTPQIQEELMSIIQAWLSEAFEVSMIDKPCTLETALLDGRHQCLYLSFSTNLCSMQKSTLEQLCVFESLLKTIRHAVPSGIQTIQFLVNHTVVKHPHLNLTKPIALTGFKILPD